VVRDITEAKAAESRLAATNDALKLSEERYRVAFQTSIDAININRLTDGLYVDVNQAFLDIMGYTRDEVLGKSSINLEVWANPRDRQTMIHMISQHANCRGLEVQFKKKNGDVFWGQMSASEMELDGVRCILSVTRDISTAKAAENEIRNLAFYDPLTGLPNRRLLLERLRQGLAAGPRSGRLKALLLVDLDNFKTLNDTLGHQAGDLLLQEIARRVAVCVHENDTVCRSGGDEFIVILEELSEVAEEAATQAKDFGEKILALIREPYRIDSRESLPTSSIGITVFGDRPATTDGILQQADIALYQAKAAGRNTIRFFSPALQATINARATLEEELRTAIKKRQLQLYYQPQIDHGSLTGAEALVRWNHSKRGIVPPNDFIPLAEETGLIIALGDWVLDAACRQIAAWEDSEQMAGLILAVNISAAQFRQPDFVEKVLATLKCTGANPEKLKFELTESMLVENLEDIINKMTELKSRGLSFSLDDFGTGYSSLAYLKRLPLDQMKIDRMFVHDMLADSTSGSIAQAILAMGNAMGLAIIAEGVETEEQRDFLANLGCHFYQGYLFSRPLPVQKFESFSESFSDRAAVQMPQ
jgi:diguanylate cyclase (GGDEF)-like protein/PAS domain S-box-containing protein